MNWLFYCIARGRKLVADATMLELNNRSARLSMNDLYLNPCTIPCIRQCENILIKLMAIINQKLDALEDGVTETIEMSKAMIYDHDNC